MGRCICIKVRPWWGGPEYRLQARDMKGNPAKCYAHERSPAELRLRQLQRANRRHR